MEHEWEDRPLYETRSSEVETETSGGEKVTVEMDVNFVLDVKSLRRCRRCGQESVDGQDPKDTCDEALARQVMES